MTHSLVDPRQATVVESGGAQPPYRVSAARLLRSEVLRFTTVRSSVLTLSAFALLMVVIGVVAAATSTGEVDGLAPEGGPAPGFAAADPLSTVLAGATPGVLVLGVLGVLIGAREYGNGMIRTTMSAAPHRIGVVLARVVGTVAVVVPVALVATGIAYAAGTAVLDAGGADVAAWSDPGVPRAVVGTALYLTGICVLGICLGMITRSIGQGIGWLVGLVLVLPGFGTLLLPDDQQAALDYLPSNAGAAFTALSPAESGLGVAAGAMVFAAWVALAVTAATVAVRRRDV
jgi:ABC-2 type transport system permease protein